MTQHNLPFKTHYRRTNLASTLINLIGAFLSFSFFSVISPLPSDSQAIRGFEPLGLIVFGVFMIIAFSVTGLIEKKYASEIEKWYEHVRVGGDPTQIPEPTRRKVLNFIPRNLLQAGVIWLIAAIFFGMMSYTPIVHFFGILGVSGVISCVLLLFAYDYLWRPVIQVFFQSGTLSQAKGFRFPVLARLLIVLLLIGIYPPAMLVITTRERIPLLLTVSNPETLAANLYTIQLFIFIVSIASAVALAFYMTRGIIQPIDQLQSAMSRVENNQLDVQVPVTTNDELGYLSEGFNQMTAGLRQAEMMRNLLNLYVSPEVAREALLHGASLGGQVVECSVLFSDIRSFTTLSEQLAPQILIELLNRFMSAMVEAIVDNGGIVNKFGGDSLLAVFGTPLNPTSDHAACAVRAAYAMQSSLETFNEEQARSGAPTLKIGIGIASGPVIAGNVGGEERLEYTVIGSTVNLASRLQNQTKELEADILLNQSTYDLARLHLDLKAHLVPNVFIRGLAEPIPVYALDLLPSSPKFLTLI